MTEPVSHKTVNPVHISLPDIITKAIADTLNINAIPKMSMFKDKIETENEAEYVHFPFLCLLCRIKGHLKNTRVPVLYSNFYSFSHSIPHSKRLRIFTIMVMRSETSKKFQEVHSDTVARTHQFFSENSPLKQAQAHGGRPYERRIQQEQMAFAVSEALQNNRNLCVEAPTGVGKSFAYLVPAIYHALAMHKPVLITTETINLQEQLVEKDLPLLRKLLGIPFSFVLAKGRSNYLCKRRLTLASGERRNEILPFAGQQQELSRIADWSRTVQDGSRSSIPFRVDPALWNCICCETASCQSAKCPYYGNCFYWKLRHQWDKADLIVTNHALFFTDLKIRELEHQQTCPLPDYCAVVFDEAHTLEDNAAGHLGLHITSSSVQFFLNRLFNPSSGRGLLMKPGEESMAIRGQISRLRTSVSTFFSQFENDLIKTPDHCVRIRKSGYYGDNITSQISDLERVLQEYAGNQSDESFKTELNSAMEYCRAYAEDIGHFIKMAFEHHVYWFEGHPYTRSASGTAWHVELASAPLNVGALLRTILFQSDIPVILTSATLAVRGSLDYFAHRTGFCRGEGLILDSPYDYQKQVKLYLARSMPEPSEESYTAAAAEQIRHFVDMTHGRAFVLFTSYGMLNSCAQRLEQHFFRQGYNLLVHGESMSRSVMLDQFKKKEASVIFGATSFWTGVDVPGDALSNVIIAKLPFSVPNHPLIEARCERIRSNGGEPFTDYSIPEAVLKFRQGIGRLIRSKTDQGIIVVLDPRIVSKRYGRMFLSSIPECPVEYF